jgi:outer membrane lipoprotein LolB
MMGFHTLRWIFAAFAISLIAACAAPASTTAEIASKNPKATYWQGRLALKIHTDPVEAFSANFELTGDAQTGTLVFSTPIGLTAAKLEWGAQGAKLQARGEVRDFESLDALTLYATGSQLPIASLFAWLQGENPPTLGWEADLSRLADGRFNARRLPPEIPVDLKISLEP